MSNLALQQQGIRFNTITHIGGESSEAENVSKTLPNVIIKHLKIDASTGIVSNVDEYIVVKKANGSKLRNKISYNISVIDLDD